MRRFSYFSQVTPQTLQVKVASVLDVSNVIIIPRDTDFLTNMDEKMIFHCMFYYPNVERFTEVRGFRVRLQDAFFNIRENRQFAWVCVEFSKLLFLKLNDNLTMKVMGRTYNSELIVRLYTKEFDIVKIMAHVYRQTFSSSSSNENNLDYYNQHLEIIRHQSENFGEVCVNDLLALYSKFAISRGVLKKQPNIQQPLLEKEFNEEETEDHEGHYYTHG